jgi:hypothetical protein
MAAAMTRTAVLRPSAVAVRLASELVGAGVGDEDEEREADRGADRDACGGDA